MLTFLTWQLHQSCSFCVPPVVPDLRCTKEALGYTPTTAHLPQAGQPQYQKKAFKLSNQSNEREREFGRYECPELTLRD